MAKVTDVLNIVAERLVDESHAVHGQEQLLAAFNQAVKAVVIAKPDESVTREEIECVAGSRQTIPAGGVSLIRVLGVRERTSDLMYRDDPNWQSAESTGEFEFWVADERNPKAFELYPNAKAGDKVTVEYSLAPADIEIGDFDNDTTDVPINDIYMNPIVEYMLYLRLSSDPTNRAAMQQANAHKTQYANLMGLKWKGDQFMAEPKERGSVDG